MTGRSLSQPKISSKSGNLPPQMLQDAPIVNTFLVCIDFSYFSVYAFPLTIILDGNVLLFWLSPPCPCPFLWHSLLLNLYGSIGNSLDTLATALIINPSSVWEAKSTNNLKIFHVCILDSPWSVKGGRRRKSLDGLG